MMKRAAIWLLAGALAAPALAQFGDAVRGAETLRNLGCTACHPVRGVGGTGAPDLGNPKTDLFTPTAFAAAIWNHSEEMWTVMERQGIDNPRISSAELHDLFAYFYAVRYFEPAGDAASGENVFRDKLCYRCHAIVSAEGESLGPAVANWPSLTDPVLFIERMWNHGETMRRELDVDRLQWPEFTVDQMADLMAYVYDLPDLPPRQARLTVGDSHAGMKVFADMNCSQCHSVLPSAEKDVIPLMAGPEQHRTLTDLAVSMWNHRPIMEEWARATGLDIRSFEPGQMGQLLSYLLDEGVMEWRGDPDTGRALFNGKGCLQCHGSEGVRIPRKQRSIVDIVAGMWAHGLDLRDEMEMKGLSWPRISTKEMSDLVAYLNDR